MSGQPIPSPSAARQSAPTRPAPDDAALPALVGAAGYVLAVSYPVLAFSTGGRAVYQLFVKDGGLLLGGDPRGQIGPLLSAVAAGCYLLAAVGFAVRRRGAWWLSAVALGFELVMVLVVGTLTLPMLPTGAAIGGTVWRWYGVDYAFFPLFQPLLGLIWLFWPATRAAYGIGLGRWAGRRAAGGGAE